MEQLMTMQETKNYLKVSYRTLHRLVSNGTIQSVKVGRVIRIPETALKRFISNEKERI